MEVLSQIDNAFNIIKESLPPKQRLLIRLFIQIYKENNNQGLTEKDLQCKMLEKTKEPSLVKTINRRGVGLYIRFTNMILCRHEIPFRITVNEYRNWKSVRKFNINIKSKGKK